jgi:hypothetical protein
MLALLAANVIAPAGDNMTIVACWFVPQTDSVPALTSLGHSSRLRR